MRAAGRHHGGEQRDAPGAVGDGGGDGLLDAGGAELVVGDDETPIEPGRERLEAGLVGVVRRRPRPVAQGAVELGLARAHDRKAARAARRLESLQLGGELAGRIDRQPAVADQQNDIGRHTAVVAANIDEYRGTGDVLPPI